MLRPQPHELPTLRSMIGLPAPAQGQARGVKRTRETADDYNNSAPPSQQRRLHIDGLLHPMAGHIPRPHVNGIPRTMIGRNGQTRTTKPQNSGPFIMPWEQSAGDTSTPGESTFAHVPQWSINDAGTATGTDPVLLVRQKTMSAADVGAVNGGTDPCASTGV